MSLSRTARHSYLLRTLPRPAALRTASTAQRYASESSGSSKSIKDAQPKILNESPPKDHEASEDVRKHNEEMDKRADRASLKVKDEDVEKDKVHKGFWSGSQ